MNAINHDYASELREHQRRIQRTEYVGGLVIGAIFAFPAGFLFCLWVVS